jgi:hypothetical protein
MPNNSAQFLLGDQPCDVSKCASPYAGTRAVVLRALTASRELPEKEENLFFVRHYEFLGDRSTCTRLAAMGPIVKDQTVIRVEEVDPHPEIVQARKRLNFDYGKFDYVVHNGRPVLLDANKTTGADQVFSRRLNARRRHRADGIYSYFA